MTDKEFLEAMGYQIVEIDEPMGIAGSLVQYRRIIATDPTGAYEPLASRAGVSFRALASSAASVSAMEMETKQMYRAMARQFAKRYLAHEDR